MVTLVLLLYFYDGADSALSKDSLYVCATSRFFLYFYNFHFNTRMLYYIWGPYTRIHNTISERVYVIILTRNAFMKYFSSNYDMSACSTRYTIRYI